jgi:hypothetical protein
MPGVTDFVEALKNGLSGVNPQAYRDEAFSLSRKLDRAFKLHFGEDRLEVMIDEKISFDTTFVFHAKGVRGTALMFSIQSLRRGHFPVRMDIPQLSISVDCNTAADVDKNVANALAHPHFAALLLSVA